MQYLAPIVKNRQYNFPRWGEPVRRRKRSSERGYVQRGPLASGLRAAKSGCPGNHGGSGRATSAGPHRPPSPAEVVATNPAQGLSGMMVPQKGIMRRSRWVGVTAGLLVALAGSLLSGCGWRGLNSIPLPGTAGGGPGSYEVKAQMPDVVNVQPNSRVQVGDVTVGTVTNVEREGWHALLTMRLDGNVKLPANATAKIGQTSLLGSLEVELAAPTNVPAEGGLRNRSLIPLSARANTRRPSRRWLHCR